MREFVICLKDAKGGTKTVIHKAYNEDQIRQVISRWYPTYVIVSIY